MDKRDRKALVAECRASGMTAKAWCQVKGINYCSYLSWATKLNKEVQLEPQPQQWAHVTITPEQHLPDEIKLTCGKWTVSVETGFSSKLLADVLCVMDAVC